MAREIRLGRIPERQLLLPEPDHGGRVHHRHHWLRPRPPDAAAAADPDHAGARLPAAAQALVGQCLSF